MIMKARYILFAVAALVLAACYKTNEQPEPDGPQMTFRAYQEGSQGTKTTVQNGGTQVYWEPADEIKVFFKGSGSRFVSQNTTEATVADFSGTLNILIGANEGASSTTKIFGLYPYRADAVSDGSSVTTTLPAEQTGRAGSFAKNTHISIAATNANSVDLGFYNVTGGLRFSLTQEGIKSVTFEGNNGENLAGKMKLAFESGIPAIKEVSEGEKVITLSAPGGGTFQTGQWYYIEVIPGILSKGFKMVFSKGNESAKLSSSSSVTIGRGKYGSLADADEGLIFKESGGDDEPDPSSVIQFADPIAKYACVEKFDTNGDQEVSYEEAAAATSLKGLFTNWNTVTSFDEIKYFTGVKSTEGVFSGLAKLKSISIPEFITTLGTFQNCSSLESVALPDAISSLPAYCFDGCSALTNVELPGGITSVPDYCFRDCSALTSISFPAGLKTIGSYSFKNCSSISSVDCPASLTSMGQYAFSGCSSLVSAVLPSDMTVIPDGLFQACFALRTITLPSSLMSIGKAAFSGCRFKGNDYTLELPSTVTSIGSGAFGPLRHLIIPSISAVSISSDSFPDGYTLLYVPAGMVEMYKVRTNWSNYKNQILPIGDYPAMPYWLTQSGTIGSAIDLGLSVKWASWNVGASAPEEYGTYFTWGETVPQWDYDCSTYKWCNGDDIKFTKYCTDSSYWDSSEPMDNKTVLDPEDDAARVNWGGSWRMPTREECDELINNCTWTWTTQNGVNGRLVTGPNGKSIFLPAAGYRQNADLLGDGRSCYYLSSVISNLNYYAYGVISDYSRVRLFVYYRTTGQSIRPVCP